VVNRHSDSNHTHTDSSPVIIQGSYTSLFKKIIKENIMHQVIYIVGLIVVVMAVLSFVGLA